jgi:NifB/MoaA-like Fe-S oxidoreductase
MIEYRLTFPAEHFQGQNRAATRLEKALQNGQRSIDMKAIVVLLPEVNDVLLKEAARQFLD